MTPEQMLKKTMAFHKKLEDSKKKAVFVGLPKGKTGSAIYESGATVLEIGSYHEYGARINHPGGTPYIMVGGRAKFISKDRALFGVKVTKPHLITIPRRSFLRTPFSIKDKELRRATLKQFIAIFNGRSINDALGLIGVTAQNISQEAFITRGYGSWKDIATATKTRKGSSQSLVDTGTLRNSITWVVRKTT